MSLSSLEIAEYRKIAETHLSNGFLIESLKTLLVCFETLGSPFKNEVILLQSQLSMLDDLSIAEEDRSVLRARITKSTLHCIVKGLPDENTESPGDDLVSVTANNASDPSLPFHVGKSLLKDLGIDLGEAEVKKELRRKRIVFVSCPDPQVLKHAISQLTGASWMKDHQALYIVYTLAIKKQEDFELSQLLKQNFGQGTKQLFIVELGRESESRQFFEPLQSLLYAGESLTELAARDNYVLVTVQSQELLEAARANTLGIPIWEVPYLEAFLALTFEPAEASTYSATIKKQIDGGAWVGISYADSYDFYQEIHYLRKEHSRKFVAAIEARDAYLAQAKGEGKDIEEFLADFYKTIPIDQIPNPENPLAPYLWYVAIYFPGISLTEFGWLVNCLLHVNFDLRQLPSSNPALMASSTTSHPSLTQLWNGYPDYYLRKSELCLSSPDTNDNSVEFEARYIQVGAKKYLDGEHGYFSRRCFQQIMETKLWEKAEASPTMKGNLIQHIALQASKDAGAYGHKLLLKILICEEKEPRSFSPSFPHPEPEIILLRRNPNIKLGRAEVTPFMVGLIKEMLKYSILEPEVGRFLNILIDRKHAEWVLELTRRLLNHLPYKPLKWLKRIIDTQENDLQAEAGDVLEAFARENNIKLYEILEEVASWLPESTRDRERYSNSHRYSLTFLFRYLSRIRNPIDSSLGTWPTTFPVFASFAVEGIDWSSRLSALGKLFSHPSLPSIFEYQRGKTQTMDLIRATVLEEWGLILLGTTSIEANVEGKALFIALLELLSFQDTEARLQNAIEERARHMLSKEGNSITVQLAGLNSVSMASRLSIFNLIARHLKSSQL